MMLVIIVGVASVTFVLSRVLPSSPAELMLGGRPSTEQIEAARKELGLDLSLWSQYRRYVGDILQGNFGNSLQTGQSVRSEIAARIGATFELTTISVFLVLLIGIPLGVLSAVRQNSLQDNVLRAAAVAGVAMPSFMLAMILQMVFYGMLGWLPLQGRIDRLMALDAPVPPVTRLYLVDTLFAADWSAFFSALSHIVLPVATLTVLLLATVVRITRNTMVEVLKEDYIRTAFAYGLPARTVHYRYALKATLIPMLTVVGLTYGHMLGGAVVVEHVFDWPGLGSFLVTSIIENDYPASIGTTIFLAAIYLFVNLVVDLLYYVVDPRLRTQ